MSTYTHLRSNERMTEDRLGGGRLAWTARDELLDGGKASVFARALGAELRAQRVGAGLTREELATVAGLPSRTLDRIETGVVDPKAGQVTRMVWTLHMSLADFYALVEMRTARLASEG